MSTVSTSFGVLYPVRQRISITGAGGAFSSAFDSAFDSALPTGFGVEVVYNTTIKVSFTFSIQYAVRIIVFPSEVFSIEYGVDALLSRAFSVLYGVKIPISFGKSVSVVYDVRSSASDNVVLQYDVATASRASVSKSFEVVYSTLVTSVVNRIFVVPIEVDSVPPQLITTSSF